MAPSNKYKVVSGVYYAGADADADADDVADVDVDVKR